jgi:nitroreductase
MDVKDAIQTRRSYRSLAPMEIKEDIIADLAECAHLAPSCKNHQPSRFLFVNDKELLNKLFTTLTPNNKWAERASMIIVAFSNVKYGCIMKERLYYLFETGIATSFILLRATELGLVAHPIAGFDESKVKSILKIPNDMRVITLIIIGLHNQEINPELTDLMKYSERNRPQRISLKDYILINEYHP